MDLIQIVLLFASCGVVIATAWFVSELFWWLIKGGDE